MPSFTTRFVVSLLSCLTIFSSSIAAAANNGTANATSSVFVYTNTGNDQSFVFALNADEETNDLYFHMSAPGGNSWMAVGFGSQMEDSLILVAYASSNGTGITLSPRVGAGHYEPAYYQDVTCDLIWGPDLLNPNQVMSTGFDGLNGNMAVDAVCHNATNWGVGQLQLGSSGNTAQPMIFAVGPGLPMQSDSLSASLRRHDFYAQFTIDMQQATSPSNASVPPPNGQLGNYSATGASAVIDPTQDNDPAPAIHGFVMCVTYVLIFPLGSLILRVLNRVILHAVIQTIGLVLTLMATAGGIVVSMQYQKSRHFQSAHQVIGILLLLALLSQLGLGITNHRIFKKENRTTILGKIHLYLGPAIILFGLINAGLGFDFAGDNFLTRPYTVIVIVVGLLYAAIRGTTHFCNGRRRQKTDVGPGPEGFQQPQFGPPGGPPAYGQGQAGPRGMPGFGHSGQDVPLQPYENGHSQQAGLYARPTFEREPSNYSQDSQAQQPRPMV